MPFEEWKALHQIEASDAKLEEFKKSFEANVGTASEESKS